MEQDLGEIIIKEELGEGCKKCETLSQDDEPKVYCMPHFDQEAIDKAMNIIIEKIERTIYGIEDPNKPAWIPRHSGAQDRKRPHDSSRLVDTYITVPLEDWKIGGKYVFLLIQPFISTAISGGWWDR